MAKKFGVALAEIPLFRSLPAAELAIVLKTYPSWDAPAGTIVLAEGQPGAEFYVILSGQVEIVRALGTPEESHLRTCKAGEFIGEVGLVTQEAPRTVTARVVEDARLLTVTYGDFNALLIRHPKIAYELAIVLGEHLSEALRETISKLTDFQNGAPQFDDVTLLAGHRLP